MSDFKLQTRKNHLSIIFGNDIRRAFCVLVTDPCAVLIDITEYADIGGLGPYIIGIALPAYAPEIPRPCGGKLGNNLVRPGRIHSHFYDAAAELVFLYTLKGVVFFIITVCLIRGEGPPILLRAARGTGVGG